MTPLTGLAAINLATIIVIVLISLLELIEKGTVAAVPVRVERRRK